MAIFSKLDDKGCYIDIVDDDNDYVTLIKNENAYIYRIRGPIAEQMYYLEQCKAELESCNKTLLEQRDFAMKERDELLFAIYHTKAMKRFLSNTKLIRKGESDGS